MNVTTTERYTAYKESGVEWLGEIPVSWSLKRHKDFLQLVTSKCSNSELLKVGLENIEGKTGRFIKTESEFDGDGVEFLEGDILFGKLRPYLAKVYLANFSGSAVGDIFVYRPKREADSGFAAYLMLSDRYIDVTNSSTAGAKMPRVSSSFIANLPVAVPTPAEQTAIADYLDTKTGQIDRKIDLLSQKATQYGKLKQSLINETVTRGLDPSVPMKASGVEWIGDVPAHWKLKRLKELAYIQNSNVDKKSHDDEIAVRLCNYVDVYKNEFINNLLSESFMQATANASEIQRFALKNHDVLITKDSETADDIAVPALVTETLAGVLCGYHLTQIRTNPKRLLGSYLFRLFQSISYNHHFETTAKGITRVGLGQSAIADAMTPVPPLSEQVAIATYLNEKTAQMDLIVSTINNQIGKLKELRKVLINDVVTGQMKVVKEGQAV